MSDPTAKAERSKAKDARQMPAPGVMPKRTPGKKHKPWRVEYKAKKTDNWLSQFPWWHEWSTFGKYRSESEANTAIDRDRRKHDYYEYRIIYKE